jgi:glutaredoxin
MMIINSCFITETPGFYSGYKRLSPENKKKVVFLESDSIMIKLDSITYAINANQLYNLIKKDTRKTIVYIWQPCCSASGCISLKQFKNYCVKYNYRGIIISQYYGFEQLEQQGINPAEIYAINHKYYKKEYCLAYQKKFYKELFALYRVPISQQTQIPYIFIDGNEVKKYGFENMTEYPWPNKNTVTK